MRKEHYNLHACVEDTHWWFVARRRIIRGIACCVLDPGKQQTVVDIGCGTGANIAAFHPDFACTGIDTAPEAIRTASGRFPEVKFVCGSIADGLPNGAELADLFLCTDVLEHVYDDFGFMSSLVAAARPGSHILITVPAFMQLWSPHDESFGHYRRYDFDRLKKTWAGLPVTVRLFSAFNSRLYLPVRLVRGITRRLGLTLGPQGTDFRVPPDRFNRLLGVVFAGESRKLREGLDGRHPVFRRGVSLIALLRRNPVQLGEGEPRVESYGGEDVRK